MPYLISWSLHAASLPKMIECCVFNIEWLSQSNTTLSFPRSKAMGETIFVRKRKKQVLKD
jgi:hypothetical protein